jgi:hypothetical protein
MKKQLLTVGDSYTYGDELTDRYQAWPYKLADQLGYEVHNMGLSGSSNTSIVRRTLEELSSNHYDLIVVGWTNPGRIEWKDQVGIAYNIWPGYPTNGQLVNDQPWRASLIEFVSQHHSPEYLYQQYLIQVLLLQSYCQTCKIDLVMIDMMQNNYYRAVGYEQHDKLENQIDKTKFVGWRKFGMKELTKELPCGPGGHTLDQGHKKIAKTIYEHIRNSSRLS